MRYFFCWSFLLFMYWVGHAVVSVHYSLVVTCWERANLLARLCDVFLCFCHFSMWCPGSIWYLLYQFLIFAFFLSLRSLSHPNCKGWVHRLPFYLPTFWHTIWPLSETSSPMGNDRSPGSQHNVWLYHNLWCSKAGNSELETVTRN